MKERIRRRQREKKARQKAIAEVWGRKPGDPLIIDSNKK